EQFLRIAVARSQSAHLRAVERRHMSLVDDRHPGIFRSADSQTVSGEIIVDMKPVIVGHIVFRREVDPLFGPFGIIRAGVSADSIFSGKRDIRRPRMGNDRWLDWGTCRDVPAGKRRGPIAPPYLQ